MTLHVGDQFLSAGANDFKVLLLDNLDVVFDTYFLCRHELLVRQRGLRVRARQYNCWTSYCPSRSSGPRSKAHRYKSGILIFTFYYGEKRWHNETAFR
jgi:hypothetical protein